MLSSIKFLVTCNCILRQFEHIDPPVFHKFIVFSVINEDGSIRPSYAQCNNCKGIHRVTEVGVSDKLKKETMASIPTIEEIQTGLPEKLVELLAKYDNLDLPTWQEIKFTMDQEQWGKPIILIREQDEQGEIHGKYLLIAGKGLWKIESFSTEDV